MVVVALLSVVAFVAMGDRTGDKNEPAVAASPTTSATPAPTVAAPVEKTTETDRPAGPGDVRRLRAGLFCRDLKRLGFGYSAAIDYWRAHGQPDQMDADRNGIPCETVYAATDVSAYWGGHRLPKKLVPSERTLPAGLSCRDLRTRGVSYAGAVAYWWRSNLPDRMDIDLNGIPCETVYPKSQVNAFWYS